jgi:hypothetical protein
MNKIQSYEKCNHHSINIGKHLDRLSWLLTELVREEKFFNNYMQMIEKSDLSADSVRKILKNIRDSL